MDHDLLETFLDAVSCIDEDFVVRYFGGSMSPESGPIVRGQNERGSHQAGDFEMSSEPILEPIVMIPQSSQPHHDTHHDMIRTTSPLW
jgi:hypothetical protein